MTFWTKKKCLCEGDPELSMTRNCRVHCNRSCTVIKLTVDKSATCLMWHQPDALEQIADQSLTL